MHEICAAAVTVGSPHVLKGPLPFRSYSSIKSCVAELVSEQQPDPTRSTCTRPIVNGVGSGVVVRLGELVNDGVTVAVTDDAGVPLAVRLAETEVELVTDGAIE